MFFLFKTTVFNTVINESTTGSVRQNLTFETLKKFFKEFNLEAVLFISKQIRIYTDGLEGEIKRKGCALHVSIQERET